MVNNYKGYLSAKESRIYRFLFPFFEISLEISEWLFSQSRWTDDN